jgi:hypothetical protein
MPRDLVANTPRFSYDSRLAFIQNSQLKILGLGVNSMVQAKSADESQKYITLRAYALEKDITVTYLRGAIYATGLALPVFHGSFMVDSKSRDQLDRLVKLIRAGIAANPNGSRGNRGKRRRKPETPSPVSSPA